MFQCFFKVCFHRDEISFLIFLTANHDMIRSDYTILRECFCQKRAKSALHPVAGHRVADFFCYGDAVANSFRNDGMIFRALICQQHETRRHESLAAIRRKKIRAPLDDLWANHLDIANGSFLLGKLRLRIGHRITRLSAGAGALGRELLAATRTAGSQHFAASNSCLAGTETMAPFADQAARLKCALHRVYPTSKISIKKAAKSCGHLVDAADKCAAAESQALARGSLKKSGTKRSAF